MAGQRKLYYFLHAERAVKGYFYQGDRRIQKRICTWSDLKISEADFDQHGKLKISPHQAARLNAKIMAYWAEKAGQLDRIPLKPAGLKKPVADFFQEWIDLSAAKRSAVTLKSHYVPVSNMYISACGNHDLSGFSIRQIDKFTIYLKDQGLKAVSINSRLRTLRTFINWVREREPDFNPRVKWSRCFLAEVDKVPGVLSGDEFKALAARIDRLVKYGRNQTWRRYYLCHQRYLYMAAGTGCRLSEIFYLKWENIDLDAAKIKIEQSAQFTPKPKKESTRFLPAYLAEYLRAQRDPAEVWYLDDGRGRPAYSEPHALSTAFARHFKELGIKGVKATHGFRAGFATLLRNKKGVDLKTIQALMGLSDVKVLDHYFSELDAPLLDAVGRLDDLTG